MSFFVPSLPLPSVLFNSLIGWTSLVPVSSPLWLNWDPLHPLVPLCGIDFPLQSIPPSSLVVYPPLSLTSKPVFSLVTILTWSASERLMLREALYKWTNKIQLWLTDDVCLTQQCNQTNYWFVHFGNLYSTPSWNLLRDARSPATAKETWEVYRGRKIIPG